MALEGLGVVFPRRLAVATILRIALMWLAPFATFMNEPNWLIFVGLIMEAMLMMYTGIQSLMLSLYRNEPIKVWHCGNMEQLNLLDGEASAPTIVTTRHVLTSKLVNLYVGNRRAKLMGYSYVILAHCMLYEGVCTMNGYQISYNSKVKLDNLYHLGYVLSLLLLVSELWKLVIAQLQRSVYIKTAVQIVLLTINRVYNSPSNISTSNNQSAGGVSPNYVVNTHDCMIKSLLKKTDDVIHILTEIIHLTEVETRGRGCGVIDDNSKFGNYEELNEIENDISAVEVAIIEGCQQDSTNSKDTTTLSYEDRIISKASDAYKVARGNLRYLFFLWCLLVVALLVRVIPLYSYIVAVSNTPFLPTVSLDDSFLVQNKVEQVIRGVVLITIIVSANGDRDKKLKTS